MNKKLLITLSLMAISARAMEPMELIIDQQALPTDTTEQTAVIQLQDELEETREEILGYEGFSQLPSQFIVREILQKKPMIRRFINSQVFLPFRDCYWTEAVKIEEQIKAIKFNPTGTKIVIEFSDYPYCQILDVESYVPISIQSNIKPNNTVRLNQAGDKILLFVVSGCYAEIVDTETGKLIFWLKGVDSAVLNQAGDQVAASYRDGSVKVWKVQTGMLLHTLECDIEQDMVLGFNSTGDMLVTSGEMADIVTWDLTTETILRRDGNRYRQAELSPDGGKLAIVSEDYSINIGDVQTGKLYLTIQGSFHAFTPKGDKVVTYPVPNVIPGDRGVELSPYQASDYEGIIWDVETGQKLSRLNEYDQLVTLGEFNPAGDKLLTIISGPPEEVRIKEIETGEPLNDFFLYRCSVGEAYPGSATFNPAGDKVAVYLGKADRSRKLFTKVIRIWDLEPLFSQAQFLKGDITLGQAVILIAIIEVMKVRGIVRVLKEKAFERGAPVLSLEQITFDFNKYPHFWDDYVKLPEALKSICDPYITKLS